MIYTLTLNPALDVYSTLEELHMGRTNRSTEQFIKIGGKGINVSYALKALGIPSIPIVVLGGFTGEYIKSILNRDFTPVIIENHQITRINFKIKEKERETEVNAENSLGESSGSKLKQFILELKKEDLLIVSGNGTYEMYHNLLHQVSCQLILDVQGKLLKELVPLNPILVKPNQDELKEVYEDRTHAYDFILKHCPIILHTLGKEGAILKTREVELYLPAQQIHLTSSVGCGDAFLAGFLKVYLEDNRLEDALRFAQKCASYRAETNEFYSLKKIS